MNGSDSWPPTTTLAVMPSWNSLKTARNWGGQPNLLRIPHSSDLFTVSNALVRSMNARKRFCCCLWHFSCSSRATNIISMVLLCRRKPNCDSGTTMSTTWMKRRLNITRARTLPAADSIGKCRGCYHSQHDPLCVCNDVSILPLLWELPWVPYAHAIKL